MVRLEIVRLEIARLEIVRLEISRLEIACPTKLAKEGDLRLEKGDLRN